MKLAPAQLAKHLQGALAPVYIISGDDPLLCQEAADAIRAAARQQGFDERQVFAADASFDWGTLLQAGASMSLFAEKRLLELRLPSGKPGDKGAAAFIEYCARPAEDTVLLISLPKLDGAAQKTKWGKALVEGPQTQFVQIWPVDANQLPSWIRQRLSQAGLSASQDAVELIAARVEGNLLAAAQEIEKLKLMAEGGQITVETVQAAVADSARFDVFGLTDAILNGEAPTPCACSKGCVVKASNPRSFSGPWPVSYACWPAWRCNTARAYRWTKRSVRPDHRSGTNANH